MQTFSKILAAVAALALTVSCDSFFDVNLQDQADFEGLLSKRSSVRKYVSNLYTYLPRDEHVDKYEGGVVLRSDEALFGASQHPSVMYKVRWGDYGSATVNGDENSTIWNRYYQAINQCTILIENLHLDKEDPADYIAYMRAEARTLRAFYYFCLFRHYGPVIVWGDKMADANVEGSTLDRNTVQENVDFMVSQIDLAVPDLPLTVAEVSTLSERTDRGRVTRGMALALKSRILLYAASPMFNGCDLYKGVKNLAGKDIFPQEADPSKWEAAEKAAREVLALEQYELVQPKGTSFQDYADAYSSVFFENWNSEIIWGWWFRTWAPTDPYAGSVGGLLAASVPMNLYGSSPLYGWQLITPSLKQVDCYPMFSTGRYPVTGYERDGKGLNYSRPQVDAKSGYVMDGWEENYKQPVDASWAPAFKAHKSTVGRDPRYYASLVPNGFWWPNKDLKVRVTDFQKPAKEVLDAMSAADKADPEKVPTNAWQPAGNINRVGYTWRRWYKANTPLNTTADYANIRMVYPEFRLAEIYYNLAEACNEQGKLSEACEALNKVRNRVGLNNIEVAYPELDQALMRWCIRQDKMAEFGMEAQRHYDAIRTLTAKAEYPCDNWTLHLKADNYEDSWQRVNTDYNGEYPAVFTDRDYLFPMSAELMAEMVNYTQNYGF
ncbi:MAG: RagB/SusD family nutrient uptake outer membrane protein [Bacteroidales bacterium]|nr:RagB/SusD family nutrient uptake outer membrane protein [Bacteroidales bacterium]